MTASCRIKITGIVQGVGFRPHVYRLAMENRIRGWVLNSSAGVVIEAEGDQADVENFCRMMMESPPPLAVIRTFEKTGIEYRGFKEFTILMSEDKEAKTASISPDIAICEDCKREVKDHKDRRFGYPFTNCTNCGPRFTIIKDVPYDRDKTTMAPFPMCPECREEYENPLHRRFHAQPNACPICGPHINVMDAGGNEIAKGPVELLKEGHIIAVKGLGAFHLAADATNPNAVRELRNRKRRDAKPFAVMARDLDTARKYCFVDDKEARWLTSPQAPIIILEEKTDSLLPADIIHPGISTLGVMLPYTPLHYLLFDQELDLLIMTSANISDEPLIIDNDEAIEKLSGIADYFVVHNREIFNPCDDSVARATALGTLHFIRRARGFVPRGIKLPFAAQPVLALGGEMKSTFCITREDEAFVSQHWGDLNHYLNYRKFLEGIPRFKKMLAVEPVLLVHDLHPNYMTTRWANEQSDIKKIAVQHHYAHLVSAMAENGLDEEVLGVICDGTGWGTDGAVWGFEILKGDYRGFSRLAHLKYLPLPGGDLTIKRPYRMALVYLSQAMGDKGIELAEKYLPDLGEEEKRLLVGQINSRLQVPTSSCGRLFDAVSAFLGVCGINRYEGQAAIELEAAAAVGRNVGPYRYSLGREDGMLVMDVFPLWQDMAEDHQQGRPVPEIAAGFHSTLVEMMTDALCSLRDETGIKKVVLSGGVFHNQLLLVQLTQDLIENGFIPYQQTLVPPGDGGISLGQAAVGAYNIKTWC